MVSIVVQRDLELVRHVINDLLAEGVKRQVKVDGQAGQAAQIDARVQLQTQGNARDTAAFANYQQTGRVAFKEKAPVPMVAATSAKTVRPSLALARKSSTPSSLTKPKALILACP